LFDFIYKSDTVVLRHSHVAAVFLARDSIYAERAISIARPSVRLSHGWISQNG